MESNYMTQVAKMLGVELYEEFKTESTERGRFFYGSEVDVHVRFMFDELSLKRYNPYSSLTSILSSSTHSSLSGL